MVAHMSFKMTVDCTEEIYNLTEGPQDGTMTAEQIAAVIERMIGKHLPAQAVAMLEQQIEAHREAASDSTAEVYRYSDYGD